MRDSYEHYLLGQGLPIPIEPYEITSEVKIIRATKDGLPYSPQKALAEVQLRKSSKAYRTLLKRDYAGLRGYEGLEDTVYTLYTDTMRTLTVLHRSPNRSDGGKFIIYGEHYGPGHKQLYSGITLRMIDRLQSA